MKPMMTLALILLALFGFVGIIEAIFMVPSPFMTQVTSSGTFILVVVLVGQIKK